MNIGNSYHLLIINNIPILISLSANHIKYKKNCTFK